MGATLKKPTPTESNLETTALVWLDDNVNKLQENIDAQQRLRKSINHLKTFEHQEDCEQYIRSLSEDDRIVLIVSGQLGQKIVPRIHQKRQIVSIYVYCGNRQKNEQWIKEFNKIRGLAVQLDELIGQIRSDQTKEQHNKMNEPFTFTTFKAEVDKEQLTTGLNGQFLHSQLFIDCLLQIKSTLTDMNELISRFQQEYYGNKDQLALVQEFQDEYSSDQALRWYTRKSFVYRMLNKALRAQNIHLIFLFRFLIRDLEEQLKKYRCSSRLTIYRGQLMSEEELNTLKRSVGKMISINSFFSTSRHRDLAYTFLLESTDLERVLFEIDADPRLPGVKPFADITSVSYFPKEEEVLFMLGSIFRLVDIRRDRNAVWTIKLTLCSDRDHDLTIFNHMKLQDKQNKLGLMLLGDVLRRMGKFDDAERYYRRCLDHLPSDDYQNISACYYALGHVADNQGDYEMSLEWFRKSLEIDMQILKPDDPIIAKTHNGIANTYNNKGDYKRALEWYNKALVIFRRALGEEHPDVAMCLNNMGAVYQREKKYSEALPYYEKALATRKLHLPKNHPDLGASHNNVGIVHRHLGHSDLALEHYNHALKIYEVSLPPQHPDIAMTLENIGLIHEDKRDWEKALSCYKKAESIYRQELPPKHPDIVQIEQSIQRVSSKLA